MRLAKSVAAVLLEELTDVSVAQVSLAKLVVEIAVV